MSSVQTGHENPTELRLDYKDIVSGQLVIVIHGLPTADRHASPPGTGGLRTASPNGSRHSRSSGSPSAPLIEEAEAIIEATGYAPALFTPLLRAAWRGQEAMALDLIAALIEEATAAYAEQATAFTEYAKAVLYNGVGRYEDAVAAAQRACAQDDVGFFGRARLELVEAGSRSDARGVAMDALRDLEERSRAGGTDWTLGIRARSAALLSDGRAAEDLYREAIQRFGRGGVGLHRARAQLVYGEWLRRENRRVDAREQLRAAHEMFSGIGTEGFAARARHELAATGETARRRTDDWRGVLTPQESHIARLAKDGLSNPEIGAQLFISPRTVQYHLRKVFVKLEITSRNHLGRLSPDRLGSMQLAGSASELSRG